LNGSRFSTRAGGAGIVFDGDFHDSYHRVTRYRVIGLLLVGATVSRPLPLILVVPARRGVE
jgi:hypothetical protein